METNENLENVDPVTGLPLTCSRPISARNILGRLAKIVNGLKVEPLKNDSFEEAGDALWALEIRGIGISPELDD